MKKKNIFLIDPYHHVPSKICNYVVDNSTSHTIHRIENYPRVGLVNF